MTRSTDRCMRATPLRARVRSTVCKYICRTATEPQRPREVTHSLVCAVTADLQRVQACGIRALMCAAVHIGDVHLRRVGESAERFRLLGLLARPRATYLPTASRPTGWCGPPTAWQRGSTTVVSDIGDVAAPPFLSTVALNQARYRGPIVRNETSNRAPAASAVCLTHRVHACWRPRPTWTIELVWADADHSIRVTVVAVRATPTRKHPNAKSCSALKTVHCALALRARDAPRVDTYDRFVLRVRSG
jgi:hypothetical protein